MLTSVSVSGALFKHLNTQFDIRCKIYLICFWCLLLPCLGSVLEALSPTSWSRVFSLRATLWQHPEVTTDPAAVATDPAAFGLPSGCRGGR